MRDALLVGYTYVEFAACLAAWIPIQAAAALRHRRDAVPRVQGRWMRRFGRVTSSLTPLWRFSVEGDAPPDIAARGYVVVANHESHADPFLLSHLPWDMRWVAKAELFRIPVVGLMLKLSGDLPIRRGDAASAREMLDAAKATLARGLSVMMFPEGTRSEDGTLGRFKDGAFRLAIEAQAPLLPVVVQGTRDCMPKHSRTLGRARATARVLAPIETRGLGPGDVARLREEVRARIAAALGQRLASPPAEIDIPERKNVAAARW
jgi:1-acyl-sn-glycerol-3-phosphate acyltransferase